MAKKKTTKKATKKNPGIIAYIVECLKKKPHTKQELLAKLTKKFKDRKPEAMIKTIHCQVPSRLKAKYKITKDKDNRFKIK